MSSRRGLGVVLLTVGLTVVVIGVLRLYRGIDSYDDIEKLIRFALLFLGFALTAIGFALVLRRSEASYSDDFLIRGSGGFVVTLGACALASWVLLLVSFNRYPANPLGSPADEYCPPVFESVQQRPAGQLPPGYEQACAGARRELTRKLLPVVGACFLVPLGSALVLRRRGW